MGKTRGKTGVRGRRVRERDELFLVRALASLVAAKVTLNPHTQDPRLRHPKSLHGPVGHLPPFNAIRVFR